VRLDRRPRRSRRRPDQSRRRTSLGRRDDRPLDARDEPPANLDPATVHGFGREWRQFTQETGSLSEADKAEIFRSYFDIFPWHLVGSDSVGADIGCGSGRWATLVAPRVRRLLACDASAEALAVARRNLEGHPNVDLQLASIDHLPTADRSLDFAYCLGVLHHLPDARAALSAIACKLKPGAPLLVYIYYAFDNRPRWYRALWRVTDIARRLMARLPHKLQMALASLIALFVYLPLARAAALLDRAGRLPRWWPLAYYRHLWILCHANRCVRPLLHADGTAVQASQIAEMLQQAGFENIVFSPHEPFWCAVASRSG
jgi:SAM-dependent methyltransferase